MAKPSAALVMSRDQSLIDLVRGSSGLAWRVEPLEPLDGLGLTPDVRMIVLDDSAVETGERGWLLAQIRHRAPGAMLIYVTADHGPANETRARASGAQYYTSKPVEPQRFAQVLRSFAKAAGLETAGLEAAPKSLNGPPSAKAASRTQALR